MPSPLEETGQGLQTCDVWPAPGRTVRRERSSGDALAVIQVQRGIQIQNPSQMVRERTRDSETQFPARRMTAPPQADHEGVLPSPMYGSWNFAVVLHEYARILRERWQDQFQVLAMTEASARHDEKSYMSAVVAPTHVCSAVGSRPRWDRGRNGLVGSGSDREVPVVHLSRHARPVLDIACRTRASGLRSDRAQQETVSYQGGNTHSHHRKSARRGKNFLRSVVCRNCPGYPWESPGRLPLLLAASGDGHRVPSRATDVSAGHARRTSRHVDAPRLGPVALAHMVDKLTVRGKPTSSVAVPLASGRRASLVAWASSVIRRNCSLALALEPHCYVESDGPEEEEDGHSPRRAASLDRRAGTNQGPL